MKWENNFFPNPDIFHDLHPPVLLFFINFTYFRLFICIKDNQKQYYIYRKYGDIGFYPVRHLSLNTMIQVILIYPFQIIFN